ncbi:MAG: hypothetical protein J1D77_01595 [Muribaculaceae bacterium]|nr:hypothetical protein [Muribaculaceae bacterium]
MRYKEILLSLIIIIGCGAMGMAEAPVAYDIDMAKEICQELPLENLEGIWVYPDDNVTVLILNDHEESMQRFPSYTISVVETADSRLRRGDKIGKLFATAQENVYRIELSTERKNDLLLKPKSCLATLSSNGDAFIIKKQKLPFKSRLNLNFSRLLPGFWKIVSTGISPSSGGPSVSPPVGLVKIFPSYDGNGSSRRKIRYL